MQETTLRQDNTNRIRTLQAARFLFILLIYLSHSVEPLAHSPFDFGGEGGVAFFFVLSGFCPLIRLRSEGKQRRVRREALLLEAFLASLSAPPAVLLSHSGIGL